MQKGVVAAGHQVTAEAAAEILAEGGNAFDAALAGMLASCVPEVVLSSLGGGGFLMARTAQGKTTLYDFFVQTPKRKLPAPEVEFSAIHADFGPARQEFHIGAGAAATPGFVPGLFAIHDDLGRLPLKRIAEPAIRAARDGVEVSPFHAYLFTVVAPILTATDGARACFAPNGHLLQAGETYTNGELASTLSALAEEGPRLFIDGEVGQAIIAQSTEQGGQLTADDLQDYRVERRAPLAWRHRAHELALNPAPAASGPLIAFALGLAERLHPSGTPPKAAELCRVMSEANNARTAHADAIERLAAAEVIAAHLETARGHAPATRGTTHISVIDAEGNAAAATVTNGEGNGYMVDGYGFMLNNMLGEEDLNPQGFHRWQPDMRMSSMMAPTIITGPDGRITALGSGGSNRIRSAILQVAINLIDRGMTLAEAVAAPRVHVEKCGTVSFEDIFSENERTALLSAFPDAHAWPEPNMFFGGVHTAMRHGDGRLEGAGDPRRCGVALTV